jgi:hypothetical protein
MALSVAGYFVFVLVYGQLYASSPEFYGVAVALFSRGVFWLVLLLALGIVLLVDFTAEYVRREFLFTSVDIAMEAERCVETDRVVCRVVCRAVPSLRVSRCSGARFPHTRRA